MKGKITKKERETKEKETLPYFPERLPKLYMLRSLLATLMDIMECIILTIRHKDNATIRENNQIFTRAIGGLTSLKAFMYFAIRNGTHYLKAVKEVGEK
jgi:hypothetical protein